MARRKKGPRAHKKKIRCVDHGVYWAPVDDLLACPGCRRKEREEQERKELLLREPNLRPEFAFWDDAGHPLSAFVHSYHVMTSADWECPYCPSVWDEDHHSNCAIQVDGTVLRCGDCDNVKTWDHEDRCPAPPWEEE